MTKTISIAFEKGGVGKTASAFTIASILAEKKFKTLLIDADPQGSLSICFGIDREELTEDLSTLLTYEINAEELPDKETFIMHVNDYLDIIPAKSELKFVREGMERADDRDNLLRYIIEEVKDGYDFVFIDNNPSLNLLSKNALIASDYVLIPTVPDLLSTDGIFETLDTISKVKKRLNKNLEVLGILFTLTNEREVNDKQYIQQNKEDVSGIYFFEQTIPKSTEFKKGLNESKPITQYNPANPVAIAYEKVTEEILERLQVSIDTEQ